MSVGARFALGLMLAPTLLAPSGNAQCPAWDDRFGVPGFDWTAWVCETLDLGSGPALYVGGDFTQADTTTANRIARWDGSAWTSLGTGLNGSVRALATYDDGTGVALYAAGYFTQAGGVQANAIAKWNGMSWSALGQGLNSWVHALAVFDDGSGPALYAAGYFTQAGGTAANRVAKWNGASWSAVGSGLNHFVSALAVFDDGAGAELYAAGQFTQAGGQPASYIARWDGSTWSNVGGGTDSTVLALHVDQLGGGPALYVGGTFTQAGGATALYAARWSNGAWIGLGSGVGYVYDFATLDAGSGASLYAVGDLYLPVSGGFEYTFGIGRWTGTDWEGVGHGLDSYAYGIARFDDGSGPALHVVGDFTTANGYFGLDGSVPAQRIARWDGATWSPVGQGEGVAAGQVRALAGYDDGSGPALYATGSFSAAGQTPAQNIARWSGAGWSSLGTGLAQQGSALAVYDGGSGAELYAGGDFRQAGGVPVNYVARWNGTTWSTAGGGTNGPVAALLPFDDGSGPALYAAGSFSAAGAVSANRVARWDGTGWSALGSGVGLFVSQSVACLAAFDDGTGPGLYVGGAFTIAGGSPASNLARWNGTSWSAVGGGLNGAVHALAVHDDGNGPALYAAGAFTTAGGVGANRIARWNGTSWSALGTGSNSQVYALASFNDGDGLDLYAAGAFGFVGGTNASQIARWNGTSWSALGTGLTGNVPWCLTVFQDGADAAPDLYVGGSFSTAGSLSSAGIAQWHGCPQSFDPICLGDGSGATCPCGNVGLPGRGCDNSASTGGAELAAVGTTAPDTLVLSQGGELSSSLSIFLQGNVQLASPVVFGDGLRCTGGALKRLYVKTASAGSVSAPQAGDPSITTQSAALGDPLAPGATRYYQVYYRDPDLAFCPAPPGDGFNVGNALKVVW